MYDELIKDLRESAPKALAEADFDFVEGWLKEAADAIEKLAEDNAALNGTVSNLIQQIAELSKPRWIPVVERLPEEMDRSCGGWSAEIRPSDDVLVWLSDEKRRSVAWYSHTYNEWTTVDENTVYCFEEVTHWMPLPESPKEET